MISGSMEDALLVDIVKDLIVQLEKLNKMLVDILEDLEKDKENIKRLSYEIHRLSWEIIDLEEKVNALSK